MPIELGGKLPLLGLYLDVSHRAHQAICQQRQRLHIGGALVDIEAVCQRNDGTGRCLAC